MEYDHQDDIVITDKCWKALASGLLPELVALEFTNNCVLSDVSLVCRALKRIGSSLLKLHFMEYDTTTNPIGNQLLTALARNCHLLQSAYVSVPMGTADKVIAFMLANPQLRDVGLDNLRYTVEDAYNTLVATEPHQHLKRFECDAFVSIELESYALDFVRAFERFPALDCLAMFDCKYIRTKGWLHLPRMASHRASLKIIFAACSPIRTLNTIGQVGGLAEWIGQQLGGSLLQLHCGGDVNAVHLITHCTQLEEIHISLIDDEFLRTVARTCKQLRKLLPSVFTTLLNFHQL